ncbi:MAG: MotA/TolQ/ExbB proton channel family protein [Kiritimatiellia bacterium]|nr:MotA/TolQ/ExbB proton channel family protein [Kiritimatiellia bacterium]
MLTLLMDGGWMMLPLLACSILGLAVIIDRARAFRAAGNAHEALRKSLRAKLEARDLAAALGTLEGQNGPVAATLLTGVNRLVKLVSGGKALPEATLAAVRSMQEYAPKALRPLENRLNLLVLVAAVSPLLGMTGTVTGMISSFDVMASSAGLDPGAVAGGIGEALITTAAGLIVAIPCAVAYNLYTKRIDDLTATLDTSMTDFMETVGDD